MKVLVCDPISVTAVDALRSAGIEVDVNDTVSPERLLEIIAPYHAIVVRSRTKVRKALLDAATSLRVIVRGGVGIDNIDVDYAQAKGVRVLNTPAASTESVAELTIGFIFALARPIAQCSISLKAGKWEKSKANGTEVTGKTLGIIGLGRIGRSVGAKAAALGMNVLGYDSFAVGPVDCINIVGLPDLFAQADYITLHVPFSAQTEHLINSDAISRMKTGVKIINCARGGIIDEEALYNAIVAGKVSGAALDTFENEPLTDNKLVDLPQVIGSPHMGASTAEATDRIAGEVADVLVRFYRENSSLCLQAFVQPESNESGCTGSLVRGERSLSPW